VAFDATSGLVYVVTRAGGTLAVLDREGAWVANLALGTLPNDVITDGHGVAYATTMFGATAADGVPGTISRITLK
jgi:hypothetical protein